MSSSDDVRRDVSFAPGRSPTALLLRRRDRDPRAREMLIRRFMPLAARLARRQRSGREPLEDFVQVANMALVSAVDRFEPARGDSFAGFANATIAGALKQHARDHVWAVHVPRGAKDRALIVQRASREIREETGRPADTSAIAQRTGMARADVEEAGLAYRAITAHSLDALLEAGALDTRLAATDPGYERAETRVMLTSGMRGMSRRDRGILAMRFVEDRTQSDIAERVGCSQMHVSRVLRRGLDQLACACGDPARSV